MAYFAVCAAYQQDAERLREWVAFHKLAGVERFFLYDLGSDDDHLEALGPYLTDGTVVQTEWRDASGREGAYEHCIAHCGDDVKWLAFVDVGEYLFSPTWLPAPEVLGWFDEWPAVSVDGKTSIVDPRRVTRPSGAAARALNERELRVHGGDWTKDPFLAAFVKPVRKELERAAQAYTTAQQYAEWRQRFGSDGVQRVRVPAFSEGEAEEFDVSCKVTPQDPELKFGIHRYLKSGRSATACLRFMLRAAGGPPVRSLLDLPCGYGRILRYLQPAFPDASITACDVVESAVDFCAEAFGATPVYSAVDPEEIEFDGKFDLIWSGSLLTHLDDDACAAFLRAFSSWLEPGGVVVFTTHGEVAYRYMKDGVITLGLEDDEVEQITRDYEETGFGFAARLTQGKLGRWGNTLSSTSWVRGQIAEVESLELVQLAEHAWDGYQDVFCCRRTD